MDKLDHYSVNRFTGYGNWNVAGGKNSVAIYMENASIFTRVANSIYWLVVCKIFGKQTSDIRFTEKTDNGVIIFQVKREQLGAFLERSIQQNPKLSGRLPQEFVKKHVEKNLKTGLSETPVQWSEYLKKINSEANYIVDSEDLAKAASQIASAVQGGASRLVSTVQNGAAAMTNKVKNLAQNAWSLFSF